MESLGELPSNIAQVTLSILGTYLYDTSPNLPVILQDTLSRHHAILTPEAAEWRAVETEELLGHLSITTTMLCVPCVEVVGLSDSNEMYRTEREWERSYYQVEATAYLIWTEAEL